MNSTILAHIIPPAESLSALDLDEIRQKLEAAAAVWTLDEQRATLYETELQRELRAKVDLCGSIPGCLMAEDAFNLSGLALLAARREASQKFNQVFTMAPLSRHAQTPTLAVPLPDSPRPSSSSADRAFGHSYLNGACG